MKIRSTGIANMNMTGKISRLTTSVDDQSKVLVVEIGIQKPRKWDVVVKIDANDLMEILKQATKSFMIWDLLIMMVLNKGAKKRIDREE